MSYESIDVELVHNGDWDFTELNDIAFLRVPPIIHSYTHRFLLFSHRLLVHIHDAASCWVRYVFISLHTANCLASLYNRFITFGGSSLRVVDDLLVQVLWYPGCERYSQLDDGGSVQRRETS